MKKKIVAFLVVAFFLIKPVSAQSLVVPSALNPSLLLGQYSFLPFLSVMSKKTLNDISPLGDSQISGRVEMEHIEQNNDTKIKVSLQGLKRDAQYLSIYHKNDNCEIEDGSIDNSINGAFYADELGNFEAEDIVKAPIDRIHSVSVRTSNDFKEVACARI